MRVGQLLWKGTVFHFHCTDMEQDDGDGHQCCIHLILLATFNYANCMYITNFVSCGYYYCTSIHLSAYISSTGGKFYHKTILISCVYNNPNHTTTTKKFIV